MYFAAHIQSVYRRLPTAATLTCLLWSFAAASQLALCAQTVPPPLLKVRLQTHLTSYASKPGSTFQAVVISDYKVEDGILIPRGSTIYGTVRRATSVGIGFRHERARLTLQFQQCRTPDGQSFPLTAKLVSLENARERVLPNGQIQGILAAQNPNGFLNGFWYKPGAGVFLLRSAIGLTGVTHKVFEAMPIGTPGAAALLAVRFAVFRFPEPEIHLPPGTEMNLAISALPDTLRRYPEAASESVPEPLSANLEALPWRTTKPHGQPAGDIINVAFVGTRQQLIDAFAAAGWFPADPRSARSISEEYLALSSRHNYATAPVSRLFYGGSLPDLVFQKSLNTIVKRDHIRIWRAGVVNGEQVWLGAATHDRGVTFRASRFAFSHLIDGQIDQERAKVADDLSFAGCAGDPAYVERPAISRFDENSLVTTDGQLAVIRIHSCQATAAAMPDSVNPPLPGNKVTRITRRFVLESRNYFLRENAYYWTYQLIRFHGHPAE